MSETPASGAWEPFAFPGIDVRCWRVTGYRRPGVPGVDPSYVFREELVRELAWAIWPHDNLHPVPSVLVGPKGCGKTSLIVQLAAYANVPVFRVNLNVGTTVRHLKGQRGVEDGRTMFVPGVATLAMETGGWLILDELSGATPPVALSLFPILEPDGAVILEDEQPPRYVRRHPDFRVFATDNTIGAEQEDSRFLYGGTNPDMNDALMDRFGSCLQVDYLSPVAEHEAVTKIVPGINPFDLEGIIRVARAVRESKDIGVGFSTRMVVEWARRVAAGHMGANGTRDGVVDSHILKAAYPAFLSRMRSKVERDAVAEVIRRKFDISGGA